MSPLLHPSLAKYKFSSHGTSVTTVLLPRILHPDYAVLGEQPLHATGSQHLGMVSLHSYWLVVAAIAVLLAAYALLRRKPKTPEELERERRAWLDGVGRITDGTVIDVQELAAEGRSPAVHLIYKYDVAGVSYECSQDVTYLRQWINLHSCRLGLHTSVKYDPQNPGNSLVVSESWMGLRH